MYDRQEPRGIDWWKAASAPQGMTGGMQGHFPVVSSSAQEKLCSACFANHCRSRPRACSRTDSQINRNPGAVRRYYEEVVGMKTAQLFVPGLPPTA
jgi:hypothetical protein